MKRKYLWKYFLFLLQMLAFNFFVVSVFCFADDITLGKMIDNFTEESKEGNKPV